MPQGPQQAPDQGGFSGAQLAALLCTDDRLLKAHGVPFSILKGCVPVDGDTYDVPAIVAVGEFRRKLHGQPEPKSTHRSKFGTDEQHREFSAVTHVAAGKGEQGRSRAGEDGDSRLRVAEGEPGRAEQDLVLGECAQRRRQRPRSRGGGLPRVGIELPCGIGTVAQALQQFAGLALAYVARTRRQSDQFARVHFADTVIDYRDDNRHLWQYIEDSDDEEFFDDPDKQNRKPAEVQSLPPRRYPEWDAASQTYRPDWASVYEALHPAGKAADIEAGIRKGIDACSSGEGRTSTENAVYGLEVSASSMATATPESPPGLPRTTSCRTPKSVAS